MNAAASRWFFALAMVASAMTAGTGGTRPAEDEAQGGRPSRTEPAHVVGNTHNCDAFYPEISRRRNESGDVLVRYDVSADGSITHVAVVKSSGYPELDLAAVTCVSTRWRDAPARRDGVPVASPGHRALIRFSLQGTTFPAPPLPEGTLAAILLAAGLTIIGLGVLLSHWVTRGPRIAR